MKSNKLLKKINRKQEKAQEILDKFENEIKISKEITKNLLILNGGFLNEINKEKIYELFSPFGEIGSIIMRVGRSYSFISFIDEKSAINAVDDLNGKEIIVSQGIKTSLRFYLYYIVQVPNNEENLKSCDLPSGFRIIEEYIDDLTEKELMKSIIWDTVGDGSLKHRRVKHYGARFDYLTNDVDRSGSPIDAFPLACTRLLNKMMENCVISKMPDQLTVNQYQPGQGIPPHVDTHSAFEDEIVVLSLQSKVVMDFTSQNGETIPVLLNGRSLAIISGESRYFWSHGITPRRFDVIQVPRDERLDCASHIEKLHEGLTCYERGVRTSFTFRKIRNGPCECGDSKLCDSLNKRKKENLHLNISEEEASKLEKKYVHQVYEKIANHFSDTRHSCWPKVASFLNSLPPYSIVLDCGCGNGKYLHSRKSELCMVGCDRSMMLCQICQSKNHNVLVADVLCLPFRNSYFDAVISIAVIHHLATENRRLKAIKELMRVVRAGGLCLIYVWAFEQNLDKEKSKYLKRQILTKSETISNRPSDCDSSHANNIQSGNSSDVNDGENNIIKPIDAESGITDVENCTDNKNTGKTQKELLGFNLKLNNKCPESVVNKKITSHALDEPFTDTRNIAEAKQRLHITVPDSTKSQIKDSLNVTVDSSLCNKNVNGLENNNRIEQANDDDFKLPTHNNRTEFTAQDLFVPWHNKSQTDDNLEKRFYHVYKTGELMDTCMKLSDLVSVLECYYDQGNWCVILRKL